MRTPSASPNAALGSSALALQGTAECRRDPHGPLFHCGGVEQAEDDGFAGAVEHRLELCLGEVMLAGPKWEAMTPSQAAHRNLAVAWGSTGRTTPSAIASLSSLAMRAVSSRIRSETRAAGWGAASASGRSDGGKRRSRKWLGAGGRAQSLAESYQPLQGQVAGVKPSSL